MKNVLTNVSALSAVLSVLSALDVETVTVDETTVPVADLVEKVTAMKSTFEKKRTTVSKADREKAVATENTLNAIVTALTALDKPSTISEIQATDTGLAILTNQKMSAMLKKLVDGGKVEKLIEKKKAYFRIIKA